MLVLTRRRDEDLIFNGPATLRIVEIRGDKVRLGVIAEKSTTVYRTEVLERLPADAIQDFLSGATHTIDPDSSMRPAPPPMTPEADATPEAQGPTQ